MKKTATLFLGCSMALSTVAIAQQTALLKEGRTVGEAAKTAAQFDPNEKEAVIWSENFSSGIPSSWTNEVRNSAGVVYTNGSWEYRGPSTTPPNTVGSRGAWGPFTPIVSPSASNGFIIFDSDFLDSQGSQTAPGSGPAPAPHLGRLITDTINLTGNAFVELKMHSFARQWNSSEFKVAISNNGGVSYIDTVSFHEDLLTNQSSASNTILRADISDAAGNQANVVLAFLFDGLGGTANFQGYYFWMIDDIEIRDLPRNEMRFTEANGAPKQDIIFNGGGARQPKSGWMSLDQAVPVAFDGNVFNYGTRTQTNVRLKVEIFNGTTLVTTLNSPSVSSLSRGDTATFATLTTPSWTPTAAAQYRVVYTFQSDSISGTQAERDTFNLLVTNGDNMLGNNSFNVDGLDNGVFSNRFGTDITDFGTDGGGIGNMIRLENGNDRGVIHAEGVQIRFSTATVDGGDIQIELYDTTGFDFNTGFAGPALLSEQFTLPVGTAGGTRNFIFQNGTGPNNSYEIPEGTYYLVMYLFSNAGANEIIIANDASFGQTGRASIMYFTAASRWYSGYTGSRTFNSPHLRLLSEMNTGIGLEEQKLVNGLYPNPSTGAVKIALAQGGDYELELIDAMGRVVHREQFISNGEVLDRDFSHLSRGMYTLSVKTQTGVENLRLSIQ